MIRRTIIRSIQDTEQHTRGFRLQTNKSASAGLTACEAPEGPVLRLGGTQVVSRFVEGLHHRPCLGEHHRVQRTITLAPAPHSLTKMIQPLQWKVLLAKHNARLTFCSIVMLVGLIVSRNEQFSVVVCINTADSRFSCTIRFV